MNGNGNRKQPLSSHFAPLGILAIGLLIPRIAEHFLPPLPRDRVDEASFAQLLHQLTASIHVLDYRIVGTTNSSFLLWGTILLVAAIAWGAFRCSSRSLAFLLVLQAAAIGVLAFSPVTFNADPAAYVLYGRLYGVFGINPYTLPKVMPHDSITQAALLLWEPLPANIYGPLWTLFVSGIAHVQAHASLHAQWLTQRAVAAAATLATSAGLFKLLRKKLSEKILLARLALFAFNPLVLLKTAVDGHNDILMVACAVWAFALIEDVPLLACLLMGASLGIKFVSFILLPFFFLSLWKIHKQRLRTMVSCASVTVLSTIIPGMPFAMWKQPLHALFSSHHDAYSSLDAIVGDAYMALRSLPESAPVIAGQRSWTFFRHASAAQLVEFIFLFFWFCLWSVLVIRYARSGNHHNIALAVISFLWTLPFIGIQYFLWVSPLLLEKNRWGYYVHAILIAAFVSFPLRFSFATFLTEANSSLVVTTIFFCSLMVAMWPNRLSDKFWNESSLKAWGWRQHRAPTSPSFEK